MYVLQYQVNRLPKPFLDYQVLHRVAILCICHTLLYIQYGSKSLNCERSGRATIIVASRLGSFILVETQTIRLDMKCLFTA
jgi:hypothetical protein